MIGILVGLVASWLLLWLYDRKNLFALGLIPSNKFVGNFLIGFFVSAIFSAIYFISIVTITKTNLTLNTKFTINLFFLSFWWTLKSVLFEELLFRGALLYIAIQKLGIKIACIISAAVFGIYHWFSYGVLGDPMQMILTFVITGIGGLMFAYAFAFTKSLYLPIGLHLGWNFITIVIFSQGPLGEQFLISNNGQKLGGMLTVVFFLFQVLVLPLFTYWYLRRQKK